MFKIFQPYRVTRGWTVVIHFADGSWATMLPRWDRNKVVTEAYALAREHV